MSRSGSGERAGRRPCGRPRPTRAGRQRRRARAAIAVLCLTSNACYSFVPVGTPGGVERGATVRVDLTTPVDVRLTDFTANDIVLLRGELIRLDTSTLALSASWLRGSGALEFAAEGETVTVPRTSIGALAEKRFSLGKTLLFVGGIVTAALLIQGAFHPIGGGGGGGGGGPIL